MNGAIMTRAIAALAVTLVVAACGGRDLDAVGTPGTPLVLMLSPAHAPEAAQVAALSSRLSVDSGLSVEVHVAPNARTAIASANTNRADAWLLPVFDYLFCRQSYGVEAGLRVVRAADSWSYRGEILVKADGPIKGLADLDGKRVAFVDPYSTSGFLLPLKLLRDARATPIIAYLGSHDAALAEVRAGRADAAATYVGAAAGDETLRSLGQTDTIPNEPVFFRKTLAPETRARLSHALKAIGATESGRELLRGVADITGFVDVDDAVYTDAGAMIEGAGKQIQDLVPEGWWLHNQNQMSPADYAP